MHLNYLPLRFTSDVFKGGVLAFEEFAVTSARLEEPARVNRIEVEPTVAANARLALDRMLALP